MSDIACPYCFTKQDIPIEMEIIEDTEYEYSCANCKKIIYFEAWVTTHFVTSKFPKDKHRVK